ncbi:MAG: efflux transporter outer membrane subunit [Verrucomicrobiota bacterium JB023]|nr:efflux transporter outer membrane subunit [Verrucomicrobiota bacterium JB023]
MLPFTKITLTSGFAIFLSLSSCTNVGPDYEGVKDNLPSHYKNSGWPEPLPTGDPFKAFKDRELNRLLAEAGIRNQDLAAALARIDQARATLGLSRADQLPSLDAGVSGLQNLDSRNANFTTSGGAYGDYEANLNLSYEVDLWGRVRRSVNQATANLQASEADYAAASLSLKSELARNYLTLRSLDREIALLKETSSLRQRRLELTRARAKSGTASDLDVSRAETEAESNLAEIARLENRRGELENAIAALVGQPATNFAIATKVDGAEIPNIPAGVPSDLLRRRPDVLAAERRLAAANEGVGLSIAEYLPRLTLTGSGGVSGVDASDLFNRSSRFYSFGPNLFVPIFQGGRIKYDRERSEAIFREALADYRQTLLGAIRDTETAILGTRTLNRALSSQEKAAEASARTARLSRVRYEGGLDSLFEVIETERQTLEQERLLTQTRLNNQLAAVNLIQAIGGEWKSAK